ncbi:hypothetical protein HOB25_00960 [bacterium]|jgi:hypothetical protein|nr:hypothetical protein [bacterium]
MNKKILLILAFLVVVLAVIMLIMATCNRSQSITTQEKQGLETKNTQEVSSNINTKNWQTHSNSHGFSLNYPSYLTIEEETSSILKAKSDKNDWFSIKVTEQSLDGFEYIDHAGSFGFIYSANNGKWENKYNYEGLPENLAPKKYENDKGFLAYYVTLKDGAGSGNTVYIEDPKKKYVITLSQSRNITTSTYSEEDTFFDILKSLEFN